MNELKDEILERIAAQLKAMGNPFRLKILHALDESELSVNQILATVGGSQANVSKHLNTLRNAGLVQRRSAGVNALYSISDADVFEICHAVCDSLLKRANTEAQLIADVRRTLVAGSSR